MATDGDRTETLTPQEKADLELVGANIKKAAKELMEEDAGDSNQLELPIETSQPEKKRQDDR